MTLLRISFNVFVSAPGVELILTLAPANPPGCQMEEECAQFCDRAAATKEQEEDEEAADGQEAMLWSLREALEKQTLQIGASACGATAVVDVLKALGVDVAAEEADRCVRTRLRRNESPLPDYLLSRSEAGTVCLM